jgi:hypothetical protein
MKLYGSKPTTDLHELTLHLRPTHYISHSTISSLSIITNETPRNMILQNCKPFYEYACYKPTDTSFEYLNLKPKSINYTEFYFLILSPSITHAGRYTGQLSNIPAA